MVSFPEAEFFEDGFLSGLTGLHSGEAEVVGNDEPWASSPHNQNWGFNTQATYIPEPWVSSDPVIEPWLLGSDSRTPSGLELLLDEPEAAVLRGTIPYSSDDSAWIKSKGGNVSRKAGLSFHSAPPASLVEFSIRSDSKSVWRCEECKDSFETSQKLELHARAEGHRAYVCKHMQCRKRFSRRDTYVRHVATHKNSNVHICTVCSRNNKTTSFKRKDHLLQHERNLHPELSKQSSRRGVEPGSLGDASSRIPPLSASLHSSASSPELTGYLDMHRNRQRQDAASTLNTILGGFDSGLLFKIPLDVKYHPEKATLVRALACMAISEPDCYLTAQTKAQLTALVNQLEQVDPAM